MYADDTTVYASAITPDGLNAIFNKELDTIDKWIFQTKLILNTAKTKPIIFGSNILSLPEINLVINKTVQQDEESKLLGIFLDKKLS